MPSPSSNIPKQVKHYILSDPLGSGAFSTVVKALNTQNNVTYACKVFPKSNLTDKGDHERFQREINTMAYLRHDSLVALYDFFWDSENFYMIIDYCPGGELFDYIVKNEKLNEPTAALLFQQIASAIAYCHSFGVAHRDLKPENVLISKFPIIKVSDFGLCGFIDEQKLMKTFCGSPCYCAPECLCRVQYDGRLSDIWSLGVILFAMITGEHPWNISNTSIMLRQILKGAYTIPSYVSPKCKDLIKGMMKVDPQGRMTMEQILQHPWLKAASKAKVTIAQNITVETPELPPAQKILLADISEASAKSSTNHNFGITSPFKKEEESEEADENKKSTNTLPNLCVRCSSVESFRQSTGINTGQVSTRKRFQPTQGLSIASNRQRSAANLITSTNPRKTKQTPMMTIME